MDFGKSVSWPPGGPRAHSTSQPRGPPPGSARAEEPCTRAGAPAATALRTLATSAHASAAEGQLRSGVRRLLQGRRCGARALLCLAWPRAFFCPASPRPPLQRAPVWPPAPRRWLPYAGPAVTAAVWCASPTENSAKPRCSRAAGVDTGHPARLGGWCRGGAKSPATAACRPASMVTWGHGGLGRSLRAGDVMCRRGQAWDEPRKSGKCSFGGVGAAGPPAIMGPLA